MMTESEFAGLGVQRCLIYLISGSFLTSGWDSDVPVVRLLKQPLLCSHYLLFHLSSYLAEKAISNIYQKLYIYLYKIWNSKVTSRNWTQSLVRVFRKPIPQKNSCETVFLSWIVVSVHYHNTNLFLYRVTCMMNLLTATQPLSSPLSQYPTDALQLYRL